ncbi:MAG: tetratricopeptide repeat protein [Patescibacteria group bacterium]|nr:tetratricopeptide repeat protein [Patescibacteria group bacterium]
MKDFIASKDWRGALEVGLSGLSETRDPVVKAELHRLVGSILLITADEKQALVHLTSYLEVAPPGEKRGMALYNVGLIHAQRGDLDKAESALAEAATHFTGARLGDCQLSQAFVATRQGKYGAAQGFLDSATKNIPAEDARLQAQYQCEYAYLWRSTGRVEAAATLCESVLSQTATHHAHALAAWNLASIALSQGDTAKAQSWADAMRTSYIAGGQQSGLGSLLNELTAAIARVA